MKGQIWWLLIAFVLFLVVAFILIIVFSTAGNGATTSTSSVIGKLGSVVAKFFYR